MQRLDRERHLRLRAHTATARRSRRAPARRASARSREPFGSPPTTRMRHCAPIAAASSMARRLSSSAARRPASSDAGNMPPRQRPVTVRPCARMSLPARSTPQACTMSRHGEIARDAGARAALDQLFERPCLHGHRIDREPRTVVREITHHALPHDALSPLPPPASTCERWGGLGWGDTRRIRKSPPTPDPSPPLRGGGEPKQRCNTYEGYSHSKTHHAATPRVAMTARMRAAATIRIGK